MKPIDQSCTLPGKGDSLEACLASIVEVALTDVPASHGLDSEELLAWLPTRGFAFAWLRDDLSKYRLWPFLHPYCVIVGPSPRDSSKRHAVVGEITKTGIRVVHDPHPSRDAIGKPWSSLLVLFDAAKWRALFDAPRVKNLTPKKS